MKLILGILLMALALQAGTITITVRNDSNAVVSTTTLQTSNTILTALNNWRVAQILTPATTDAKGQPVPAVLKYPTVDDWWRAIISDFIRDHILTDYHPLIIAERVKIDAANNEIKRLKGLAVQ